MGGRRDEEIVEHRPARGIPAAIIGEQAIAGLADHLTDHEAESDRRPGRGTAAEREELLGPESSAGAEGAPQQAAIRRIRLEFAQRMVEVPEPAVGGDAESGGIDWHRLTPLTGPETHHGATTTQRYGKA